VSEHQHGYITQKDSHLARLKKIEGQVRGLHRMVEDEKYCIDILTQVSAVTSALESVSLALLAEHMNHCVVSAAREGDEQAQVKIDEAMAAIKRLVK
jgi:CsoR family transcriptional regulator, copper-sensing transcriptional repressor